MYWPIGSPKAFALSRHVNASITTESDDGIEGEQPTVAPNGGHSVREGQKGHLHNGNTDDAEHGQPFVAASKPNENAIVAAEASRGGHIFVSITQSRLTVWQCKPVVALASIVRSAQSIRAYGSNVALLLRPDAMIVTIQTSRGFLISYSLSTDPSARVYQVQVMGTNKLTRRDSVQGPNSTRRPSALALDVSTGEGEGIREISLRFRMAIRIDAGINAAMALDNELVVATQKPAAIQCVRWVADDGQPQTRTEVLSRMTWLENKAAVTAMLFDRPMKLTVWVTADGRAHAVRSPDTASIPGKSTATSSSFQGFTFHKPETEVAHAKATAVSSRFSLIAVGRTDGAIDAYVVKDYSGNAPLSHRYSLPSLSGVAKGLVRLNYSPDGYCLFAAYENGWAIWSVYGKVTASSFQTDATFSKTNDETWLQGVRDSFWIGGGCELALIGHGDDRIWVLDIARSASVGCHSPANVSRGLLQTSESVVIYHGHDTVDLTSIPTDVSLWQVVQIPSAYLVNQWPIKTAVVSADGRYIAVAGRRGLAHYSVSSGRWKTFDHPHSESEFSVRGGMSWYQNVLIAAVEVKRKNQIRLYSREKALDFSHILHTEDLPSPAIFMTVSGTDSLLVYTHDNNLLHYIVAPTKSSYKLVQVGQIGFHGVIRAPPRVRALSWILPDDQMEHGDPSQDVATASVLFLVDGKLVLLQPSVNELGQLKYDMRVIVQNSEYFLLARDQRRTESDAAGQVSNTAPLDGWSAPRDSGQSLRDSLWYFDGANLYAWPDVLDVLASAPADLARDLPLSIRVTLDFYPVSALLSKGIINGLDADLVQRRDVNFSFYRIAPRTQLFLPQLLRYHIAEYNSPAALHLARSYEHLPYLSHALEMLLHQILDSEVDNPPSTPEAALLPTALSFLSSFPAYLDIIVNCARKTELRSWRTLFETLPPVSTLFEQSLAQDKLKTAAGYLLVLHAFQADKFQVQESARLLRRASAAQDWELCRELARFLVGIDSSGETLRTALAEATLGRRANGSMSAQSIDDVTENVETMNSPGSGRGHRSRDLHDYFSTSHRLGISADRYSDGKQ